jgi:hypothetical protein
MPTKAPEETTKEEMEEFEGLKSLEMPYRS